MDKIYTALGLMSGSSGDGVDASIIKTNGNTKYEVILDEYYKYTDEIYKKFHNLKQAIEDKNDWTKLKRTLKEEIDIEKIDFYQGAVSEPFDAGNHKKIAVKIVDNRGIESLIVRELA